MHQLLSWFHFGISVAATPDFTAAASHWPDNSPENREYSGIYRHSPSSCIVVDKVVICQNFTKCVNPDP